MKVLIAGSAFLISALLYLVAVNLPATAEPRSTAKGSGMSVPKIEFEKYTLPNGLQVILHVDRKLPVVNVNQWFHVGSKNEKPGRTGFAHLFEHMMFQGSKNAPGEYFSFAERAGANLREGGVNGTTDTDRTNYFATVPSGNLELLLWLESDRLATLDEALTQEKLDNQREVVRNERRQGLENRPYGRWDKLLVENLHPKGHPYSWDVIGVHEDLVSATLDDVTEFFQTYYTPNNLSLVVTGDFEPAEAKRLIEKYFGNIPPGPPLDRPSRWIPTLQGEKVVEAMDRVPQERTFMAWPAPPYFEPGDAELDLASYILTDGLSSRLKKVLVYERELCTDVSSFQWSAEISSTFVVDATARPGASLAEIETIITAEIAKLAKRGPTSAELERAQTKWEYQFVTGLERIGGFGGKADRLNRYNVFLGDPGKFEEDLGRYMSATSGDVRDAVARWIDTPNRLLIRFRPEESGRETAAALDRSGAPELGEDRPFHPPQVQSAQLDNGLELFVVERRELPKVAVSLVNRAGSMRDPAGREGVAHLTVSTIDLGTKTRKALEIENALGDLGVTLGGSVEREVAGLSFEALSRSLSPALDIVADVVRNPTFAESEVQREKNRLLDFLAQQDNNPNSLWGRIAPMIAFGRDHPYGRPPRGLAPSVREITRADLAAFHEAHWKPGSSALIFVGDLTLADATALAEAAFGDWTGAAPPAPPMPPKQPLAPGKIYLVDRQGAAQTVVAQLLPGPKRQTEDYYALSLADAVWGGAFQARLNLNLREDKGYSYGVFSRLFLLREAGVWSAGGGVQTDKTAESVAEFESELRLLAGGKPITAEELEHARANRVRGYAQKFETHGQIADEIGDLWALGLPMSELEREVEGLERTKLEAVNAAARRYAVPEEAALLLVGDRARIEGPVRDLKLGDIVVLDVEGRPLTTD